MHTALQATAGDPRPLNWTIAIIFQCTVTIIYYYVCLRCKYYFVGCEWLRFPALRSAYDTTEAWTPGDPQHGFVEQEIPRNQAVGQSPLHIADDAHPPALRLPGVARAAHFAVNQQPCPGVASRSRGGPGLPVDFAGRTDRCQLDRQLHRHQFQRKSLVFQLIPVVGRRRLRPGDSSRWRNSDCPRVG